MKIIAAIDIINGKVVRLTKGNYDTEKIYHQQPLDVAKLFEANGIKYLHLVDLDGAKSNHIVNHKILNEIATHTALQIDFGGGIKSDKDVAMAFDNGAHQITVGSVAVTQPALFLGWLKKYGATKIILGADCINMQITTHGWQKNTAINVIEFIQRYQLANVTEVICTDVSKDGMLQGPSTALYKDIITQTNIHLIASGGIASLADIAALKTIGCHGAIIGKAIYENKISLKEISELC